MSHHKHHTCPTCTLHFSTSKALQSHMPVCDLAHSSKNARKRTVERATDSDFDFTQNLNLSQLTTIVKELARRNYLLEQRLASMEKIVGTKKKRIQIDKWLNTHLTPTDNTTWWEWYKRNVHVSEDVWHQFVCFDITPTECVGCVWRQTWNAVGTTSKIPPFYAVVEDKHKDIYVFAKSKDAPEKQWRKLTHTDLKRMQSLIYNLMSDKFDAWKKHQSATDVRKVMKHISDIDVSDTTDMSKLSATIYDLTQQPFRMVDVELN